MRYLLFFKEMFKINNWLTLRSLDIFVKLKSLFIRIIVKNLGPRKRPKSSPLFDDLANGWKKSEIRWFILNLRAPAKFCNMQPVQIVNCEMLKFAQWHIFTSHPCSIFDIYKNISLLWAELNGALFYSAKSEPYRMVS